MILNKLVWASTKCLKTGLYVFQNVTEALRMEYRYMDLRRHLMQHNLRLRSKVIMKMREFLANQNGLYNLQFYSNENKVSVV